MLLVCVLLSVLMMLSPISACAFEFSEPIEPAPTFHGYEVLGYDDYGNAVLSKEDYEEYFTSCLQERQELIEAGQPLPKIDTYEIDSPIAVYSAGDFLDSLDENKFSELTRFMPIGGVGSPLSFLGFAFDAAKYMLEHPTMSAGASPTFTEKISSVGKKRIHYTYGDAYELIVCGLNFDYSTKETSIRVARSGFGALSTYYLYDTETTTISLGWSASGYTVEITRLTSTSSEISGFAAARIRMESFSVNSLPVSDTSSRTVLLDSSDVILGYSYSLPSVFAENTFMTNSRTYNGNHQLVTNNNNYWNPCVIFQQLPIQSGTTINQSNVNQYNQYGYTWNETTNNIDFDPDILAAYIENELLPQLELIYKDAYQKFPDIDAEVGSPDISYTNPFEDEEGSSDETLPPATLPPGVVVGGLTPEELESVLNQETYYILDMETGFPSIALESLPAVENLPAEIVSATSGISNFVIDLFSSTGLLSLFIALAVLAFVVFAFHG